MYSIINQYSELIIKSFDYNKDIQPYHYLKYKYEKKEIDNKFKSYYINYYRLSSARLSEKFLDGYFNFLISNYKNQQITIKEILDYLAEIECNKNRDKKLHFSFASKLLHTINDVKPIYDSMIAQFYFLPEIKSEWSKEKKKETFEKNYNFIEIEYERIITNNLMNEVFIKFNDKIENSSNISNVKKIDFILWMYVKLLKSGKVRDKEIIYS